MTYQKPELSVLGEAEVAILGGSKFIVGNQDSDLPTYSVPAYEVDE
jgi:hypothetical protein